MTLYLNTVSPEDIIIELRVGSAAGAKVLARKKIKAPRRQGEKLIPALDVLLRAKKKKIKDIKNIVVANRGGSFTSLRIGVITANALAYALKIPVLAEEPEMKKVKKFGQQTIVEPIYDRPPQIGVSKPLRL